MPSIKQLPPLVVNKIAAGEVIERPASVVKELMENAVDAGASRIDVILEDGGGKLISVTDDGCGVPLAEIPLAVASHATSKINDVDDLFHVGSLGFRGEALASIAAVSQLRFRSRPGEEASGGELEVNGGTLSEVAPCGARVGTTVEVRNLFFNTPVRRKFLRRPQTEMGHCSEAFLRIALGHIDRHFTLTHNGKVLHDLPATDHLPERVAAFFGRELANSLIPVATGEDDIRLEGYVASPDQSRSHNRMQYLFLNHRHIRDRALQHALGEAYRGLLLTGRYPITFLHLTLPPDLVDVNVHPTKLEVRFQDSGRLYSLLLGTLRTRFLSANLTSTIGAGAPAAGNEAAQATDSQRAEGLRNEFVAWARGELGAKTEATERGEAQSDLDLQFNQPAGDPLRLQPFQPPATGQRSEAPFPLAGRQTSPGETSGSHPQQASEETTGPATSTARGSSHAVQIHNKYLVTESNEGVLVIDQHALHERILYEELKAKVLAGQLESQQLLVPEPVDLAAPEAAAVLEASELLGKLGIAVEPFGGDTVLVSSYPAMLANIHPGELMRQLADKLTSGAGNLEPRDLLDELLHMMSCKAAIKAGDHLSGPEITALLERRHLVHDAHHCPHGRPTALIFTREELDRRFKRI